MRLTFVMFVCILHVNCSEANFIGRGKTEDNPTAVPSNRAKPYDWSSNNQIGEQNLGMPYPPSHNGEIGSKILFDEGNGIDEFSLDYHKCASLPTSGKTKYGRCLSNSVMVVINDGVAKEQTCCPLASSDLLSPYVSDLYIPRSRFCEDNEVGVGQKDLKTIYCSKIDEQKFEITRKVASQYAKRSMLDSSDLQVIAAKYNKGDTCICPEGSIIIGAYYREDNLCMDQCGYIDLAK